MNIFVLKLSASELDEGFIVAIQAVESKHGCEHMVSTSTGIFMQVNHTI